MNNLLDFFTDVTVVAAVTTASHFGIAIESAPPKAPASAEARPVRRTTIAPSTAKPPAQNVRTAPR